MSHHLYLLPIAAIWFMAGCVTIPEPVIGPVGADPVGARGTEQTFPAQLQAARRLVAAGEYSSALPRLLVLTSEHANTPAGIDAHYLLGQVYFQLGEYWEAQEQFKTYLAAAPDGAYAADSQEYVDAMAVAVDRKYETPEEVEGELQQAEQEVALAPEDLAKRLQLADLHWKSGHYAEAGAIYQQVMEQFPQIATDMTIRGRIERLPSGGFVVLTPQEVARRQAEAEPLMVFNTTSFRSGRNTIYSRAFQEIFYNVSGNVVNRSELPLREVQVTVTIYGFGNKIYDVETVRFGAMNPGEIRPFSVRFENFDNIENINRYECIGSYQR